MTKPGAGRHVRIIKTMWASKRRLSPTRPSRLTSKASRGGRRAGGETRKLNEEARKEAAAAMAIRRAHRREQRNHSGKPGGQPNGRAAPAGLEPRLGRENTAGKITELDEFEKTALARVR